MAMGWWVGDGVVGGRWRWGWAMGKGMDGNGGSPLEAPTVEACRSTRFLGRWRESGACQGVLDMKN